MPSFEKESTLIPALQQILKEKNPAKVKKLAITKILESKVNPASKQKMIKMLTTTHDPIKCIYNLILKYEGKGVLK
jgi:hypothetical protein